MNPLLSTLRLWGQDRLLRRVMANSGYLLSSNTIGAVLSMVQSVYAFRLLGVAGFGVLGIITTFATTVNRLFSFRMGELVVKYFGAYISEGKREHAAALVKAALLLEAASSLAAFLVLVLLAPLAANWIARDPSTGPLFILYGLSILGHFSTETATGVLQVGNHFRSQATINVSQSVLTAALIIIAYFTQAGIGLVLVAYMLGKLVLGLGPTLVAFRRLSEMLGPKWWRASFSLLPPWGELKGFALSSNFSATVNLIVRDSELLWVGYFLSPVQAGYYKAAFAILNLVMMPIAPLINTTFPEITRAVAQRLWYQLRGLLRKVTLIAMVWTLGAGIGLALFGRWVIQVLYTTESLPAYPALLVLMLGFGLANILFWNRPLLLSLGQAAYPFKVTLWTGLAKVVLGFLLVPKYGYVAEAALLSGYFIVSVTLIVLRGYRELQRVEAISPEGVLV